MDAWRKIKRRKESRLPVAGFGWLRLLDKNQQIAGEGACYIENTSAEGLGLQVQTPLFYGDLIEVEFEDGGRQIKIRGEVTRDVNWTRKTGIRYLKDGEPRRYAVPVLDPEELGRPAL